MPTTVRRTPGVYVTELDAFPPSVVGVQTAIPAFIGYTEKADISGKPVFKQPVKITSMVDFMAIFGGGFKPMYEFTEVIDAVIIGEGKYDFKVMDSNVNPSALKYYDLNQTTGSQFYLYNSMRLFYANGGGTCYIVSVGDYTASGTVLAGVDVVLAKLQAGLTVIKDQTGPTMLVIPDAVLLSTIGDFGTIMQDMLKQCANLQDRVAIIDVWGGDSNDKMTLDQRVEDFHNQTGDIGLSYGMAYFPFLDTTVVPVGDFDFTNFNIAELATILGWENVTLYGGTSRQAAVQGDIDKMAADDPAKVAVISQNLSAALPLLGNLLTVVVNQNDVLPPSGAMAGVFTTMDNSKGVWNAPANISLSAVKQPVMALTDDQQADLNVPIDGKAIDALRQFTGRGTVVWGARTLDGNSNDWRYIQVRRTLIYIEQSVKNAIKPFVFAANDGNTWTKVTAMVSAFLQGLWSRGGLMGATASEAFTVQCGLGTTMTGQDVLEGYMIVQVTLQMIRPAEFIELTFKQTMQGVGS